MGSNASKSVKARAGVNIALVKYWGKADVQENLPAVGSISLTLKTLRTETEIQFNEEPYDIFELDGRIINDARVIEMLSAVRLRSGCNDYFKVSSTNFVPTAAGLASSASGAAALVSAAWTLCTESTDYEPITDVIRKGSGSAPRSLLGGLVELERSSGLVTQLSSPKRWPLSMIVAQLTDGPKHISSRKGMAVTQATSPYYQAWTDAHPADLSEAREAIKSKDIERLGSTMERSTMRMHACMLAADPALIYWNPKTLQVVENVLALRRKGLGAWYTMDAGPHVKIMCIPEDAEQIRNAIADILPQITLSIDSMGNGVEVIQ